MENKTSSGSTIVKTITNTSPSTKKLVKSKSKMQRTKSSHPPTSAMVKAAIKELKDRKGSSVKAIKKYIIATYNVDDSKLAPLIKRYIKTAITSGAVVQTKGSGASGSFKLPVSAQEKIKAKKAKIPEKKAVEKKVLTKKPASSKKTAKSVKKAAVPLKKVRPSKSVPVNKAKVTGKSIAKSKKTAKALAIKTKTPKPKKVTAAKSVKATGRK
ncbi:histone H1-like [Calliopsis andreniformis]|uniref:histone H1-like n=1 Tax=Calliopsis andreniformis TaxID=337506 RepID=UPI003FCD8EA6